MRFPGGFRTAVVLFPFLTCAALATGLDRPVEETSVALIRPSSMLPVPAFGPSPAFHLMPLRDDETDFAPVLAPAPLQLSADDSPGDASGLASADADRPAARFILLGLLLSAMMMIRYLLSEGFRELISDVCSMLLAVQQEGR